MASRSATTGRPNTVGRRASSTGTPTPEAEWLNRAINLDTGCVFVGKLTALQYPELAFVSVPAAGFDGHRFDADLGRVCVARATGPSRPMGGSTVMSV